MSLYNNKIILIGGSGFLGSNLSKTLENNSMEVFSTSSSMLNLLDLKDDNILKEINRSHNCTIIFFSALTPDKGKDVNTFNLNIKMAQNFLKNVENLDDNNHVIYISSDAVYSLDLENIENKSKPEPTDLYSSMHLTREIMFKDQFKNNLTILRPTLIYGFGDTHNSYGPNRYFKQMIEKNEINVFGEGLDVRDHLYVKDLCEMIRIIIKKKILGIYNLASGHSISYIDLSNIFKELFPDVNINKIPVNNKKTVRFFNVKEFLNRINYNPSDLEKNIIEYASMLKIR
tara:strand:- start:223 stop:1083 length:861 start_codon:yes stop_codon:yes gene_type:complete